jgi:crotonobetainyl-CoA:carnitine CoA-transferase CaiB-like acyl-CoA transferase
MIKPFVRWLDREGMANDFLKEFDWDEFDYATATQETVDRLEQPTAKFFLSHTKVELLEGAVRNRVFFYPIFNTADVLQSSQLAAREFWEEVEHPELGTTITYPGAFAKISETPIRISRRAPRIGEHNQEVYEQELGITKEELLRLKKVKVI